jgi:hypothetical protein
MSFVNAARRVTSARISHYRVIVAGGLAMCLSGCDLVGSFAKELVVDTFSYSGWSTFTFKGELPANFGIVAIAGYGPDDPNQSSCRAATFTPGKTVTRTHRQQYAATIKDQPQAFSFDIPLSYYEGLCGMKLGRVALEIDVRYGQEKWQTTYAGGNIYLGTTANARTSYFDASEVLNIPSTCSFMFQESRLNFGISKFMDCKGPGAHLLRKDLSGKVINLVITVNPEEEPATRDTWVKFPNGWKPCAHEGDWRWCRAPIKFKTFQMYGRTCTIYPGCTEHDQ